MTFPGALERLTHQQEVAERLLQRVWVGDVLVVDVLGVDRTGHLESGEEARVMHTLHICICVCARVLAPVGWPPRASGAAGCFPEETDADTSRRGRRPAWACLQSSPAEQQRVVRGLRLAPTPAATRSDQTLRRYRVDHVDLLSDHLRVVDGAGIVFIHFHNNMLIHRPPAR